MIIVFLVNSIILVTCVILVLVSVCLCVWCNCCLVIAPNVVKAKSYRKLIAVIADLHMKIIALDCIDLRNCAFFVNNFFPKINVPYS